MGEIIVNNPPLTAKEYKFVDAYCSYRDVEKAAVEAGYASKAGVGLYRRKPIHELITERMGNITAEADKQLAKKRVVNVEMLDKSLMEVVRIPRKTLIETPTLATPKVKAIELGYQRVGLLIDGNFVPDASSGPSQQEAPRIYRAQEQTIITHQITETHQVVTQRAPDDEVIRERVRKITEPPTIDADEWKNF
jgi:hypothetical protein